MNRSTDKFTNVKFSERLAALAAESGRTQKEIAQAVGISEGALTNYLKGRWPRIEELAKLARYFGTNPDFLMGWEGAKESFSKTIRLSDIVANAVGESDDEKQDVFARVVIALGELREHLSSIVSGAENATRALDIIFHEIGARQKPKELSGKALGISSVSLSEAGEALNLAEAVAPENLPRSPRLPRAAAPSADKAAPSAAVSRGSKAPPVPLKSVPK